MEEKKRANQRIPQRQIGVQEKDEETIQIASRLAKAVEVPEPVDLLAQMGSMCLIGDTLYSGLPEPGHLLLDEIMKVLYLNNIDPKKVI